MTGASSQNIYLIIIIIISYCNLYAWISGRINEVKNKEKCTSGIKKVVVGRINGVVALTGCSYKKMYGRFAGPKKSGRNNEVVVLTRWS